MKTATQVATTRSHARTAVARQSEVTLSQTVAEHWPEYMIEAALIALFMLSACTFGAIYEHPSSPVRMAMQSNMLRRAAMGISMGLTAITLIYSPLGKRSGAHFNPAVTLTFFRLKKIGGCDAAFYVLAQFIGAITGTFVAARTLRDLVAHSSVNFVATVPGMCGLAWASVAEFVIAFLMMTTVLKTSTSRFARFTGIFAGTLVALYICFEAPLSGMSMNPARTLGSAVFANAWTGWWIYFVVPPTAMLAAAALSLRRDEVPTMLCAKLCHDPKYRCNFCGHKGETI